MAYTPELSNDQSRTLRRIAWALNMPMTKAMNAVFEYAGNIIDKKRVCAACKDNSKCNTCAFNQKRWSGSPHDHQKNKELCLLSLIKK
ncbi:MAG: hypothetical protein HOJ48_13425 [Desulfobacula sp.]|jgi:hypothetical protein|nr:hypothetical protein [Desulfobacula sp.]